MATLVLVFSARQIVAAHQTTWKRRFRLQEYSATNVKKILVFPLSRSLITFRYLHMILCLMILLLFISDFYNWNRVKVRYCDGASFTGEGHNRVGIVFLFFFHKLHLGFSVYKLSSVVTSNDYSIFFGAFSYLNFALMNPILLGVLERQ